MLGSGDDDRGVRRRYGRCLRFRRRAVQGGDQPHSADVAGRSGREGTAGVVLSAGPHAVRRRRTWGPRATVDGGTATAEMAVALPVLVLVLCGALWAVGCVAAQLRCTDVAGAAALAAARGEPAAEIIRRARTAGPAGATGTIEPNGSMVTVAPAGPAVRALRMISAAGSPRAAARAAAPATSVQRSCAATQPTAQSAPQSTSTRTGSATAISAVAVPPSTAARAPHLRRRLTACGPALRTTPAVPSRPDRPATSAPCGWSPPYTARRRNRRQRPYRRRTPRSSSPLASIAAHPGPLAQAPA